jgi:hypothetical protein
MNDWPLRIESIAREQTVNRKKRSGEEIKLLNGLERVFHPLQTIFSSDFDWHLSGRATIRLMNYPILRIGVAGTKAKKAGEWHRIWDHR